MVLTIHSWRISQGEPSGLHCWFDPDTEEVVLLGRPPLDSEYDAEVGFGSQVELFGEGGVAPCEGGDARTSVRKRQAQEDPPPGFLDTLWEGGDRDGEAERSQD